jgi:hypothetical protein
MIRDLKRGDLIVTPDGYTVPVLHVVSRTVPAKGRFRPMLIRAPYFGLHKDLHVAPNQRLILSGTEVEYLFGSEFVLCPVSHFSGTSIVAPTRPRSLATYMQVVLPENEVMNAAGMMVESLHLGRIRRKPDLLSASVFANTDRQLLPDHGQPAFPVLKALDALILAEHRAA